jgi:endonuclease/exonuclease/phosphatase family metal-dependent hydrolase
MREYKQTDAVLDSCGDAARSFASAPWQPSWTPRLGILVAADLDRSHPFRQAVGIGRERPMPFYTGLRSERFAEAWAKGRFGSDAEAARERSLAGLARLRNWFDGGDQSVSIPPPRRDQSHLLLATWNIREFDSPSYGLRSPEAFFYLAEILSRFDLIAVQEVREDLRALDRLMDHLGPDWSYLVSDVEDPPEVGGKGPGNGERLAYLFDTRSVRFKGHTGELTIPPRRSVRTVDGEEVKTWEPVLQAARTPLLAGFQAGWCKLYLATLHLYYGNGANDEVRNREIAAIANQVAARTRVPDDAAWARNWILLGDFNIFEQDAGDKTYSAVLDAGFQIPPSHLHGPGTNIDGDKYFDQIAFIQRPGSLEHTGLAGQINGASELSGV